MRDRRPSLALLSAALALTLLLLLVGIAALQRGDINTGGSNSAATVSATVPSRITIRRPEHADVVLERLHHESTTLQAQPQWQLIAPYNIPANDARIEPLLSLLNLPGEGYTRDTVELAGTGLLQASAIVEFDDTTITLGGSDYTGQRVYAQRGSHIHLVDDWILPLLEGGVTALARLDVFTSPIDSVQNEGSTGSRALSVTPWQALSAVQIVGWPRPTGDEAVTGEHALSITDAHGITQGFTLFETQRYAALVRTGEPFAWIMERSQVPDLMGTPQ